MVVAEGDSGEATATFTVTLSPGSDQTVTVDFATADETATAPSDYQPSAGVLVFDPAQTTQSVSVTVNGDTLNEADETYFVDLSNPTNATITDGQGVGTITDDDPPDALDRRRHRRRRQSRDDHRHVRRLVERVERADGVGRLRDGRRECNGPRRLPPAAGALVFAPGRRHSR